jgi:phenylacetate-CoA ligase
MGTGDISTSIWGECEHGGGMHFSARDNTYVELINPHTGEPKPWEDGAEGELVYTALVREAMPMLRLRSRDHVVVNAKPCACGRTTPRIRCIGRTDDMLIVRGVNLFPTAVRELLFEFQPEVGETFRIMPQKHGVSQDPPLPIRFELGEHIGEAPAGLAERISASIRSKLLVATRIEFVPYGSLPREEYKSKLVDYSEAR